MPILRYQQCLRCAEKLQHKHVLGVSGSSIRCCALHAEAEGGLVVDHIADATHAVLRHQQQQAYQTALNIGTVSVVPPEWIILSATQQQLQPEVRAALSATGMPSADTCLCVWQAAALNQSVYDMSWACIEAWVKAVLQLRQHPFSRCNCMLSLRIVSASWQRL